MITCPICGRGISQGDSGAMVILGSWKHVSEDGEIEDSAFDMARRGVGYV